MPMKKLRALMKNLLHTRMVHGRLFYTLSRLRLNPVVQLYQKEIQKNLSLGVYYVYGARVEGDIVEFGTDSGFTACSLAKSINMANSWVTDIQPKKLFLFDSFEGLPPINSNIDRRSHHVLKRIWYKGACVGLNSMQLHELCGFFYEQKKINIIEGWFKDTVKQLPNDTKFSMIHFDGDLYQSTIDALDPCFKRGLISTGAIVFFDDYDCNQANPASGERKAWQELVEKYSIKFTDQGPYSWGCRKFIIHNYIS